MLPAIAVNFILGIEDEEEEDRRRIIVERRIRFEELKLQRKQLRDASNPFALDPDYFRKHYRLTPEIALRLHDLLHVHLLRDRASGIPSHLHLLIVLRFFAEGGFQKGFAQDFQHPISQTVASRFVIKVVDAIILFADTFIKFPSTEEERRVIQNGFQETIRIPGVIGLIDCFLVSFLRPSENEEAFFNYKVGHSMNVQIISDADFMIRDIRICPGSNNDRHVWQYSEAKQYLESLRVNQEVLQEEGRYYILGDSGYTPSPVLLTPILNAPARSPATIYTEEHTSTRCKVEQLFGILTNVWMAIKRSRKLHYSVQKVAKIITACAILHNFR